MKSGRIFFGLCGAALISITAAGPGLTATFSEYSFNWPGFGTPLSNHDVVLIIDKSRSMLITDCLPALTDNTVRQIHAPVSRWQWCYEQTHQLAEKTHMAIPNGLTIVLFAKKFVTYNNADVGSVETIFADNKPDGSTDTVAALNSQIEAYFIRKSNLDRQIKPLLIAIISDGCPDNPALFCQAIVKASQSMNQPDEISITFLQVGNDHRAIYLLNQLRNGLIDQNAKFNIVDIIPFSELNKIGLPQALVNITSLHSRSRHQKHLYVDSTIIGYGPR